jgi:asparagine synthase (glutamine-hydrolysing)
VDCSAPTPVGKIALRNLYNLYPGQLPDIIRDRRKVPLDEGTGLDTDAPDSTWHARFDALISDRDFADGQREFAAYEIASKEELAYIRALSRDMDIARVPHLRDRVRISVPV